MLPEASESYLGDERPPKLHHQENSYNGAYILLPRWKSPSYTEKGIDIKTRNFINKVKECKMWFFWWEGSELDQDSFYLSIYIFLVISR